MTWQEWVLFIIAILGAVGTVIGYVRGIEKRVDRHQHILGNGLKEEMDQMRRWREDFREALPKMLETERHKMMNKLQPMFDELEERVRQIEMRRTRG